MEFSATTVAPRSQQTEAVIVGVFDNRQLSNVAAELDGAGA